MSQRIVIALGGNAILQRGQKGTAEVQFENVRNTMMHIVEMIKKGYQIVITHGNGPQVGAILLQNEIAKDTIPPKPLDVCGAKSQGLIGYMIQQSLGNLLNNEGMDQSVVTILTQVLLDREDPKFQNPTKPIGPFYTKDEAIKLKAEKGYDIVEDSGRGWRRVVPSPDPKLIVERDAIKNLVNDGFIVIASGGGGIPVLKSNNGGYEGTTAVIDKDLAGERLAIDVNADILLILTDIEKAALNYGKPNQKNLDEVTADQAEQYLKEGHFAPGSMGPKILAAIRFVREGGKRSIISSLEKAMLALQGKAGTHITP